MDKFFSQRWQFAVGNDPITLNQKLKTNFSVLMRNILYYLRITNKKNLDCLNKI